MCPDTSRRRTGWHASQNQYRQDARISTCWYSTAGEPSQAQACSTRTTIKSNQSTAAASANGLQSLRPAAQSVQTTMQHVSMHAPQCHKPNSMFTCVLESTAVQVHGTVPSSSATCAHASRCMINVQLIVQLTTDWQHGRANWLGIKRTTRHLN